MERRVKLTIAAIALSLLVAGMVRRWAKEGEWPFAASRSPDKPLETSGVHDETMERHPQVASSPAWPNEQRGAVSPAPPPLPQHDFAPLDRTSRDEGVMRASFLPNPSPETRLPSSPDSAASQAENDSGNTAATVPAQPAAPPYYPQTSQAGFDIQAPSDRYVIQPNDSYWSISQRVYGTAKYFQALFEHNRRICPQPDRLPAGVTLETPPQEVLQRSYPELLR
ncbi:MAG: hypothetical protein KY475_06145 [Planctomycetes bacterium]|nr:hypothetical protein [Planctomycetota bacterium]